ncbi:MAG: hypothetical protein SFH39_08850 [Candidatus Magnetobacterium sp. LHC-1]
MSRAFKNKQAIGRATFVLCCLLSLFYITVYAASTIDTTNKYAYDENTGGFNFNPTNGSVSFTYNGANSYLSGYLWSENIGWIRLAYNTSGPYTNTNTTNWGVNSDASGNLSGYAWSENAGWIKFNPTGSGVTINTTTGSFDGYAWGENIGYIHFKNVSPAYNVVTTNFTGTTYTVTPSAGTGGTITPSTPQTVTSGLTTQFTVTPNSGYNVNTVSGCSDSLSGTTYTTEAINADCTVIATFAPSPASLPQTGQTKCYDKDGKEIPCTGTGQDGDSNVVQRVHLHFLQGHR